MTGLKRRLNSEFVPEWCAIALLVALDIVWASRIPMRFTLRPTDFLLLGLAIMVALRAARLPKGGLMAEYFSLTLAGSTAICILS